MEKNLQNLHREEKKAQVNFMILASFFLLIPTSSMILKSLHWRTAEAPVLVSPFPTNQSPAGAVQPLKAAADPKEQLRSQQLADGSSITETMDEQGRRVSKTLSNAEGALVNLWNFEAATGKIMRYETREYREKELFQRRVATWQYDSKGGFVKTNQVYDASSQFSQSFVELVNAKHIKYQEKWYDAKKRPVSEKNWHPETGRFVSHFMTVHGLGGWSTQTYVDEKGNELRRVLLAPNGKILNGAGLIQVGR